MGLLAPALTRDPSATEGAPPCHVVGDLFVDPLGIHALCGRVLSDDEPWCDCPPTTCRRGQLCVVCFDLEER